MQSTFQYLLVILLSVLLQGCAPAIVGGGAVMVGAAVLSEHGISGNLYDTKIWTALRAKFYKYNIDLYNRVEITVHDGEVLLTGCVTNPQMSLEAVRLAWEVQGVNRVVEDISVSEEQSLGNYAQDSWITTTLTSILLFDPHICSRNYSIKTMNQVIYLMGIAQNQAELDQVVHYARNLRGVKKVVSYAKIKNPISPLMATGL